MCAHIILFRHIICGGGALVEHSIPGSTRHECSSVLMGRWQHQCVNGWMMTGGVRERASSVRETRKAPYSPFTICVFSNVLWSQRHDGHKHRADTRRNAYTHSSSWPPRGHWAPSVGKLFLGPKQRAFPELDAPAPDQHSTFEPLRPWSCWCSLWQFELSLWTNSSEGDFFISAGLKGHRHLKTGQLLPFAGIYSSFSNDVKRFQCHFRLDIVHSTEHLAFWKCMHDYKCSCPILCISNMQSDWLFNVR